MHDGTPGTLARMASALLAPLRFVDKFLNDTTMYRVVLYALLLLTGFAVAFGFTGVLSYSGVSLLVSLLVVCGASFVANVALSKLWRVPANKESWLITALILFFLFSPVMTAQDAWVLAAAGVIAIASKFVLAYRGKHVFNPAAFAAAAIMLSGQGAAIWWIGTGALLPVTLVAAFLIVRKISRSALFFSCVAVSFALAVALGLRGDMGVLESLWQHLLSWPIIFFASVMVTEPLTMPAKRFHRIAFGVIVGALSSWPIILGPVYFTPEIALLIGNLYAYAFSLRRRLTLRLKEARVIARDTYEFAFHVSPPLFFEPGQYLEWTLPHVQADDRGNRRYFTIASSPAEEDLLLGVKIGASRSTYKDRLLAMQPGDTLYAGQLGGDFLLPQDPKRKLAFIAGGIGITPFRSMIKHLSETKQKRDIVLFYGNRTIQDLAYAEVLEEAKDAIGLRALLCFNEPSGAPDGSLATIDEAAIRTHVPDFAERTFYLSGPSGMVDAFKGMLTRMGVHRSHIVTDYFPGFA